MNKHVRKIKGKNFSNLQVIILAAGVGSRTKSYEPRCLLKYKNKTILDNQIDVLSEIFNKSDISIVGGYDINRIIKKVNKRARVIENQNYQDTNSGESLRLAVNNSLLDSILFIHGDLVITPEIFDNISMDRSFILIDSQNKFEEKEVGITSVDGFASVLSYNLPVKWCQVAYLSVNELNIFKKLLNKQDFTTKYLLTFEIINKIIENGGSFKCFDIGNSFIKEIDNLKDINDEVTSR
jgi:choline kinase